jgi:hypothetical protein
MLLMRAYTVAVISVVALVAAANGSKIVSNEVRRNEMVWPRVAGSPHVSLIDVLQSQPGGGDQ